MPTARAPSETSTRSTVQSAQEQTLKSIRETQQAVVEAVRTWADAVEKTVPAVPALPVRRRASEPARRSSTRASSSPSSSSRHSASSPRTSSPPLRRSSTRRRSTGVTPEDPWMSQRRGSSGSLTGQRRLAQRKLREPSARLRAAHRPGKRSRGGRSLEAAARSIRAVHPHPAKARKALSSGPLGSHRDVERLSEPARARHACALRAGAEVARRCVQHLGRNDARARGPARRGGW